MRLIILFFFSGFLFLFNCKTKIIETRPLPEITNCELPLEIYDPEFKYEINKLIDLKSLSFSAGYTQFHGKFDSIQKNELRYSMANFIESVIKNEIPDIKVLDNSEILNKSYNTIMKNLTLIKARNDYGLIRKVTIKDRNSNQLFIEIRGYPHDKKLTTSIHIYVFDINNKDLLYYDYFKYFCDPRNLDTFAEAIKYGLNKLPN